MPTDRPSRNDVEDWARFLRLEGHVISRNPALFFQQAANQPEATAPSRAVEAAWAARRHSRPWLRWVNKAREREPALFTLPCNYWVEYCVFTPNGRQVLTRSKDLQLWDAETGALITTLTGHPRARVFALSPDGRRIVSAANARIAPPAPGTSKMTRLPAEVRVWDLDTGVTLGVLDHEGSNVLALSFSPDERLVASGTEDQTIRIWDAQTFREVHRLRHENRPRSCVFSPGGTWLAVTGGEWTDRYEVKLWDVETGSLVTDLKGHEKDVFDCAFSPDGTRLVTASDDKTLKVWDLLTGRTLLTLTGHSSYVRACDWSPDGKRIVSGGLDATVRLWDAETGEPRGIFVKHTGKVFSCAFSPDSRRIVSGGQDNIALVWDATARAVEPPPRHRGQVTGGAFSPDGTQLATTSYAGGIRLWNVATGDAAGILTANEDGFFYDCVYSPDGGRLAASSHHGFLIVWDVESSQKIVCRRVSDPQVGHVHSCSFSPDGRWLASGAVWMVKLWDAATYTNVRTLPNDRWTINACPFSPDGTRLLDSALQVWDVATGTRVSVLGDGEPYGVSRCEYSPDGARILSTWERGVRLWDAASGAELMTLQDHADYTIGCAYTRDGRWIISTSKDGELVVRDAESGAEAARFRAGGAFGGVTATDSHVAAGDAGGVVYLLELMGFDRSWLER